MSDGSGQTAWSYNAAGNPLTVRKTINSSPSNTTNNVSYTYNLNGSVASLTYPGGRVLTYTYDNAFQATSAKDPARTSFYASSAVYAPHGALSSMVNGNVPGGQPGATTTNAYDNRLLPSSLSAASSISVLNLGYSYFANGLVQQITNNRDTTRTQTFTYDALNRVKTAASGTLWCNRFDYDLYGNLTGKVLTCGTGENLPIPADSATNRVTGYSYDANGNQLTDGLGHTFTYNAENKVTSSGGTTFTYDGDGVRVKKSGWRLYWTGMGTEVLAESDLAGVMQKEYIYFAGERVAFRSVPTDTPFYYFSDHLGSANVITNGSGTSIQAESDYFPFGAERAITNLINNRYKFTGKEQDTGSEGGLTHFLFREYTTNLGRFMSPDPLAGDTNNPQSLNRYAYVLNNPLNLIDPLGLRPCLDKDGNVADCPDDPNKPDEPDEEHERNDAIGSGGPGRSGGCSISMGLFSLNFSACPGGGAARRFRENFKRKVCSLVPEGRTFGVNYGLGGVAGTTGSLELVLNYSSGQVSGFASGGAQAGWNGGASGSIFGGFIYGDLKGDNSGYSGGFTAVQGGALIGGFRSRGSGGLTGSPGNMIPHGSVTVTGISVGGSLIGGYTGTISVTNTSKPLSLGKYWAAGMGLLDPVFIGAKKICR